MVWTHLLEREASIREGPSEWHRFYSVLRSSEPRSDHGLPRGPDLPPRGRRLLPLLKEVSMVRDSKEPSVFTRETRSKLPSPELLTYDARPGYRPSTDVRFETLPYQTSSLLPDPDHFNSLEPDIERPIREFLRQGIRSTFFMIRRNVLINH